MSKAMPVTLVLFYLSTVSFEVFSKSKPAPPPCPAKLAALSPAFGEGPVLLDTDSNYRVSNASFLQSGPDLKVAATMEHGNPDLRLYTMSDIGLEDAEGLLPKLTVPNYGGAGFTNGICANPNTSSPYFVTTEPQWVIVHSLNAYGRPVARIKLTSRDVRVLALDADRFLVLDESRNIRVIETDSVGKSKVSAKTLIPSPVAWGSLVSVAVTRRRDTYLIAISSESGYIHVLSLVQKNSKWQLKRLSAKKIHKADLGDVKISSRSKIKATELVWLSPSERQGSINYPVLVAALQAEERSAIAGAEPSYPGVLTSWQVNLAEGALAPHAYPFQIGSSHVSYLFSPPQSGHIVIGTDSPASLFSSLRLPLSGRPARFKKVWSEQLPRISGPHYLSDSSGPFDPLHALAVSPDGKWVVAGSDGGFLVRRPVSSSSGREQALFGGHDIRNLEFSPDSRWLLAGGNDGVLKVYDLESGKGIPDDEVDAAPTPEEVDVGDFGNL